MKKLYVSLNIALCLSTISVSAQTILDNTFGVDGKLNFSFSSNQWIRDIAVQPDGKIITVGNYNFGRPTDRFFIKRLMPDGSADATFGTPGEGPVSAYTGTVFFNYDAKCVPAKVLILPDGKIMVSGSTSDQTDNAGDYDFIIVRFNSDGSLDTTFRDQGVYTENRPGYQGAGLMALQGNKVLASAGFNNGHLTRLNPDGTTDTSFGTGGFIADSGRLVIAPDNSIYEGYYSNSIGLVKYTPDGALDTSFADQGERSIPFASLRNRLDYLHLSNDGKIFFTGSYETSNTSGHYGLTVGFDLEGNLLSGFGNGGLLVKEPQTWSSSGSGVMVTNDKVTVAYQTGLGTNYDYTVASYNMDGTPFTDFGTNGEETFYFGTTNLHDYIEAVAIQPDGKMLLGGRSADGASLARLNPVNQPAVGIKSFTSENVSIYPSPATDKLKIFVNDDIQFLTVKMYNLLGSDVYRSTFTSNEVLIDVSQLQEGIYITELDNGSQKIVKRIVVKK